jgi:hypothetical protein
MELRWPDFRKVRDEIFARRAGKLQPESLSAMSGAQLRNAHNGSLGSMSGHLPTGFGVRSIATRKLANIAASRAELISCRAA